MLRLGLVLVSLLAAVPGWAQTYDRSSASQADQQACEPDVYRLCNNFIPDVDRIVACLAANKRALAPACRAVMSRPQR